MIYLPAENALCFPIKACKQNFSLGFCTLPDQRNHLLSTLGNHQRSPGLNELENHFPNSSRTVPLTPKAKQEKDQRKKTQAIDDRSISVHILITAYLFMLI